ncbi:ATP-binding protein [Longimicrobium sp.]|uniref:ATP-binding protein n=1 Tax=Longimicrobium sp. TaxID=2029185 RepID=UPI002E356564|nr:ATP-binding protein [Longimicrobium sp.]HEX6040716.1 ATP-binding protein [Longimicrobium sp.]
MPDGNSRSTLVSTDQADAGTGVDWERRARRLEALCGFAAEAAGTVDADEIWRLLCGRLVAVLGADAAALHTPLLPESRAWSSADGADGRAVGRLAEEDGAQARRAALPGGGAALVVPLEHGGETLGTLAVGWEDAARAESDEAVIGMLARQTAGALASARAYARLTEAAFRRERFFSAMSHDLRTPITAIVGYSELLADGIVGELNGQQLEMIERISQVSGHLSQLVNDILDLAKLDAGRMEFHREPVTLGALVDEALVTVEPQARSKKLELRTDVDPHRETMLNVDGARVRQILVNLLSNAVKFTEQGEVAVVAGGDDGRTWLEVRDTGPGLPAGSEEAVFEEFLQIAAGTKSKREPGSGLGLAISRRLARAMGGDLTARSGAGNGAAFTLVLPAAGG